MLIFQYFCIKILQNLTNTWQMEILTSIWSMQQPNGGQNNQHQFVSTKILPNRFNLIALCYIETKEIEWEYFTSLISALSKLFRVWFLSVIVLSTKQELFSATFKIKDCFCMYVWWLYLEKLCVLDYFL